jgi:hypothetical protein
MSHWKRLLLALIFVTGSLQLNAAPPAVDSAIKKVLALVERSDAKFIRNGKEYPARDASEHLAKKYDYYKKEIKTVDDFIDKCASKSILSGKPYLIKPKDGKEMLFSDWLKARFKELDEKAPKQPAASAPIKAPEKTF